VLDSTELEEESVLLEADRRSSRLYQMRQDGSLIVVKSISLSDSIAKSQIESKIANLRSLRYQLIASSIGFAESTARPRFGLGSESHANPSLDCRGHKRGNRRRSSGLRARAANCDLRKEGRKRANVRRRAPAFAWEQFGVARCQADRTEVRDLNPPIRIEKDIARFQASVQQSEAVRKPKTEGNPCNCFRFRRRSPPGRRTREHFRQRTACRIREVDAKSPDS
jgi:hypothetical protein